jgi:hypothetical protein
VVAAVRLCLPHWDRLKAAIAARGLAPLVPATNEEAAARLESCERAGTTAENFDPLMAAYGTILGNVVHNSSLTVLLQDEECCPLCYLNVIHAEACKDPDCPYAKGFDIWIDRAADDAARTWSKLSGEERIGS